MSKIKISVLCPTRRRMAWMRRLVETCFNTCHDRDQVEVVFGIDDDDHESIQTAEELKLDPSYNVAYTVWPRKKYIFSDLMNQVSYAASGEIYNLVGDDASFLSKNWDQEVIQEFDKSSDKIIMVTVQDGITGKVAKKLAVHPFMHKNWREAVGNLLPPYFNGDWADWWISDVIAGVGNSLGEERKIYRPDIVIEHLHPERGLAKKDQTYYEHLQERQQDSSIPDDEHPYHSLKAKGRIGDDISKLIKFIEENQQ